MVIGNDTAIIPLSWRDGKSIANASVAMGVTWHSLWVYGHMICRARGDWHGTK